MKRTTIIIFLVTLTCCFYGKERLLISHLPIIEEQIVTGYADVYNEGKEDFGNKYVVEVLATNGSLVDTICFFMTWRHDLAETPLTHYRRPDVTIAGRRISIPFISEKTKITIVLVDIVKRQVIQKEMYDGVFSVDENYCTFTGNFTIVVDNLNHNENKEFKSKFGKNVGVLDIYDNNLKRVHAIPIIIPGVKNCIYNYSHRIGSDFFACIVQKGDISYLDEELLVYSLINGKLLFNLPLSSYEGGERRTVKKIVHSKVSGHFMVFGDYSIKEKGGIFIWKIDPSTKAILAKKEVPYNEVNSVLSLTSLKQAGCDVALYDVYNFNDKFYCLFGVSSGPFVYRDNQKVLRRFDLASASNAVKPDFKSAVSTGIYLMETDVNLDFSDGKPIFDGVSGGGVFDKKRRFRVSEISATRTKDGKLQLLILNGSFTENLTVSAITVLVDQGGTRSYASLPDTSKSRTLFLPHPDGNVVMSEYQKKSKSMTTQVVHVTYQ